MTKPLFQLVLCPKEMVNKVSKYQERTNILSCFQCILHQTIKDSFFFFTIYSFLFYGCQDIKEIFSI